jgi:uncharacterized YccA/Bax inhibitor family protein
MEILLAVNAGLYRVGNKFKRDITAAENYVILVLALERCRT